MVVSSHLVFGAAAWTAVGWFQGVPVTGRDLVLAAVGALLPDLDHPRSWVGRRLRLVSVPLGMVVGHRGITHSLLAVVSGIVFLHWHGWQGIASPLVVGYLSHLACDLCTPAGVPLLWPARGKWALRLFPTGGLIEHGLALLAALATIYAWGWV